MLSTRVQLMPNATMHTVSQGTSMWSTLFPVEQKTVQQSATFVKKLIAVGFSSITYLRTLFPEYAYSDENLDGLNLKLLLDNSTCGPAKELVKWIQSCFDAIDKRYLRELTLAIFTDPDHPELVLETYTYRLRYTKEGDAQMEFESTTASGKREQKFDVRRPTQKLLRTVILLTQALRPLPKRVFLGMKLGYYDDVTPVDYQPEGFRSSVKGDLLFDGDPVTIKIGEVSTRFHSVKVRVSVDRKHFSDDKSAAESYHDEGIEGKTEDENKNGNIEIIRRFSTKNVSQTPPLLGKDTCSSYSSSQNFYPATSIRKADLSTIDPVKETEVMDLDQPCCSGSRSQEPKNIMNKTISDMATPGAAETMKYMLAASTPDISPTVSEMPENQTTLDAEHSFASTSYSNVRTPSVYNNCTTPGSTTSMRSQGVLISPSVPNPDFPVRCPCGVSLDDGLMILCDKCGNWQHAVCFKILDEEEAPGKHNCEICNTPTSPCTDPCLLDVDDIAFTCLYRRILVFFQDFDGRVTPSLVSQRLGVDISIGKKIIMRLNSDRLLTKKGLKWGKIVNKSQLVKNAIPLYLSKPLKMACSNSPSKEKMETATLETALTPMRKMILSDSDATPDMLAPQPQCSMSGLNDEDDIIDIMEMSQDADVGTQIPKSAVQQVKGSVCREPTHLNNMEYCASQSQALATVGNSVEVLTPQKNEDSIMEDKASEFVMMDSENVEEFDKSSDLTSTGERGMKRRRKNRQKF